ncbi:MAG: putative DNA binding domain-containing protein [Oscillospiraceae bacterium]|nr:putative DNA binding domain-containing protein [Oscillospiraceae bacterium]
MLEARHPKSWLKTVSAFANGSGGVLLFGVADDKRIVGLADIKGDIDIIGKRIKEFIDPMPVIDFTTYYADDGKDVLALEVFPGDDTPYFYSEKGSLTAYVRMGSDSLPAPANRLRELVMKGKNLSFDSLPTDYRFEDLTFTVFESTFKRITKKVVARNDYISFGMCKHDGILTYAGLMFSDECPLLQSRVFCTRWNGLTKGSVGDDAIDDKEFEGDIISQLISSHDFVKTNSKVRWRKMSDHRVNKPDYADRAVFEILANAIMHRSYDIVGSEVHVDMYDDRLEVYSPGGMADGTLIQERDIDDVPSTRRNPIIAEMFHRLDYIERRGSGFKKIRTETSNLFGYTDEHAPEFRSTPTAFHVVLKSVNYNLHDTGQVTGQVTGQDTGQVARQDKRASLVEFCVVPRSRKEMQSFIGLASREHFNKTFLTPLLETGQLKMTIPDKPNSRNQKYVNVKLQ